MLISHETPLACKLLETSGVNTTNTGRDSFYKFYQTVLVAWPPQRFDAFVSLISIIRVYLHCVQDNRS